MAQNYCQKYLFEWVRKLLPKVSQLAPRDKVARFIYSTDTKNYGGRSENFHFGTWLNDQSNTTITITNLLESIYFITTLFVFNIIFNFHMDLEPPIIR